jgi:hypothetical protein
VEFLRKPPQKQNESSNYLGADLLARIYEIFPLQCPSCGESMKPVVFITDPMTVRRTLSQLGLSTDPPRLEYARDPPQTELDFTKIVYREDIDLLIEVDGSDDPFPKVINDPHPEDVYIESLEDSDQSLDI